MVSQPTVTDHQTSSKHAFPANDEPARRGWFRRRRDFVPDPQARWLLTALRAEVRHLARGDKQQGESAPRTRAGSHPAYELRHLARVVLDLQDDHTLDYRKCFDRLRAEMETFSRGANAEAAQEATRERRKREAQSKAGHAVAAIEAAVQAEGVPGVEVALDPERLGQSVGAVWVNAHDLTEKTLVGLPKITDDMADPREADADAAAIEAGSGSALLTITSGVAAPESPVHRDETTPPVPDEPVPAAKRLPRREPRAEQDEAPEGGVSK